MNIYKGYTKNKGKRPVDSISGVTDFRTLEEVQRFDSYGGVLSDNAILIDVDEREQSEILLGMVKKLDLNCQVIRTSRGRHFTFINSGVESGGKDKKLACGLIADVKVGSKNAVECLKIDGEKRFVEREFDGTNKNILPKWLHPVNSSADFITMEEGQGRNSALYSYILTLTSAGFTKNETKECIEIINSFVLKEPLSEDEIDTITRDDAFPEETFFQGKKFLHNNFAIFLKNNDHIKRIDGQLHVYRDGQYIPGSREIENAMIKHLPTMKAAQRVEVLKYLDIICQDCPVAEAKLIAFNNGILDIKTGEMQDFSPEIVITNKIQYDYDPTAYDELTDKTLNKIACFDPAIRALLEEAVGYSFYRINEMSKAFFLTGSGSNGKSTFLDMVSNVVGHGNKSSLGLEELDERFSIASLSNKLVNIGDDISDEFWNGRSTANFRKLVSGNEVKAEFKGENAFFFKPYAKFFFSANALPRIRSRGFEAIKRRLIIIPFNAKFSKADPDYNPWITWDLRTPEAMKYLARLGVEGLKRVLENNAFTESEKVKNELEDYEKENNPIILWMEEMEEDMIVNQPTKEIHKLYKIFCIENGFQEMTLSSFSKEMKQRYGFSVKRKRIDGTLIGIYVK